MKKIYYIALVIVIGFLLTPLQSYACGTKHNIETSCIKQSDSGKEKKDSCDKDCCENEKGQCGKHGKDCKGQCSNPSCQSSTSYSGFTILYTAQLSPRKFLELKTSFYYQETYYSSGFLSIWLPPKIG